MSNEIHWICTDPDNEQYGRKLAAGHYEFKEKNPAYEFDKDENEWIQADILLSLYDDNKINNYVKAYYDSVDHIKQLYNDEEWEWLVAECIFEQENMNY